MHTCATDLWVHKQSCTEKTQGTPKSQRVNIVCTSRHHEIISVASRTTNTADVQTTARQADDRADAHNRTEPLHRPYFSPERCHGICSLLLKPLCALCQAHHHLRRLGRMNI